MRQPCKNIGLGKSSSPEVEFVPASDHGEPQSSYTNILDQAFILYSDEEMISASSQSYYSHVSFDQRSVNNSYSNDNFDVKSQKSQAQIIGNFINNEESSIYDIRQSQCSESGKELLHALQPLFKQNVFRRRSPRFVTYEESSQGQKKLKSQFESGQNRALNDNQQLEMIEDEKSPMNQVTQILEQKEEQQLLMKKVTKPQEKHQKINSNRMTRSKKIENFETSYKGNDTTLDEPQLPKESNPNDYLSRLTKDFLLTMRKQKKIKKAQKEKFSIKGGHSYSLRKN